MLDSANNNTTDPNLITRVNTLEEELLKQITLDRSISDVNLTDEINIDEAKEFLQEYCDNNTNNEYSSADVIQALWCKLSCGRPENELEDLNAPDY